MSSLCCFDCFVFFKQKTAYEMRISDWSSDVCSSDLLLVEMPVLDNAVEAAVVAYGPMMLAARHLPLSVRAVRAVTRPVPRGLVPFWAGIGLDICDQRPGSMAAILHGIVFGRLAPPSSRPGALEIGRAHVCTCVPNY